MTTIPLGIHVTWPMITWPSRDSCTKVPNVGFCGV